MVAPSDPDGDADADAPSTTTHASMEQRVRDIREEVAAEKAARRARGALAKELAERGRQLYSDEHGQAVLRLSFAVYLDALGTREASASLTDEGLRRELRALDELGGWLHDEQWQGDMQRLLTFSDNVALGVPLWDRGTAGFGLGFLLQAVEQYQLRMVLRGRLLRGGLAVGSLYADHRTITGPALVEAVRLEEQVAVFPRVLLDETATAFALIDADEDYSPELSAWNEDLLVDADGRVFVDYLSAALVVPRGERRPVLLRHRTHVIRGLQRFADIPRVREKYVWMADYHNAFCARHHPKARKLLVTDELDVLERLYPRQFRLLLPTDSTARTRTE